MPNIKIDMIEGRTDEQKEALIKEVAEAVVRSIGAPEESIRIMVQEYSNRDWGIGSQQAYKLGR